MDFGQRGQESRDRRTKYIGGACPNSACLPSKNIIHSAKVASLARRGKEFGVIIDKFEIDAIIVHERKRKMVAGLLDLHLKDFAESGAELIMGVGRFIAPKTIQVALNDGGTRTLRGTDVVVGTGTHATIGDAPGLADAKPWTNVEALDSGVIPEKLIILGGGYVGLELAQAALRLGSKVTIVERMPWLLSKEDEDISPSLEVLLRDEGADLALACEVTSVSGINGESVALLAPAMVGPKPSWELTCWSR